MLIHQIVAAGVTAGILVNVTGYLISGRLFHPYQARTPGTWRSSESWTSYLYSAGVRFFSCFAIVSLYAFLGAKDAATLCDAIFRGAAFGVCLWAAVAAPIILETALFVNWHRGFVVGLVLDWLVLCLVASTMASAVQRAI